MSGHGLHPGGLFWIPPFDEGNVVLWILVLHNKENTTDILCVRLRKVFSYLHKSVFYHNLSMQSIGVTANSVLEFYATLVCVTDTYIMNDICLEVCSK